jgi:hypothetical protein
MKKFEFTNRLYLVFLLIILGYFIIINGWTLIKTGYLVAIIPLTIQFIVLTLILLRHKWLKYGIKGYSLFFIIGSGLQLIGQLLFIIAGADEKINYNTITKALIMVLLGVIIFYFCDKSISSTDRTENEEEKINDDVKTIDK